MKLKNVILLSLILAAAWGVVQAEDEKKFENNALLGWAGKAGGLIKSFGYHLLDSYVIPEAGLAVLEHLAQLSVNLTLQLPLGIFAPYVTAGYGFSLSGSLVSNTGAGLKIWISENAGLLFGYRQFKYTYKGEKTTMNLIGVGFAYRI